MIEKSPVSESGKPQPGSPNSLRPPAHQSHQSHLGKIAVFVFAAATAFVLMEAFYVFSRRHSSIPSLVIVPFSSASAGGNYLDRGIAAGVARALSQVPRLSVVGWDTGSYPAAVPFDPRELASGLQSTTVLSGDVAHEGERITLTVRLTNARTGVKRWEGRFEGKAADAQAIPGEVAGAICNQFHLKLGREDQQKREYTRDPAAFELYLKGRYLCLTSADAGQAIEDFNLAIARDPAYALAFADLAACYNRSAQSGQGNPSDLYPQAKVAATKAVELDPQLADAHLALAIVHGRYDFDWSNAENEFKRAIALDPNDAATHVGYGSFFASMGALDEAMREMSRAVELDPFSPGIGTGIADIWSWSGEYGEAIRQYRAALALDPHFRPAREGLAMAYALSEKYAQGVHELRDASDAPEPTSTATLAWIDAVSGDQSEAKSLLSDLVAQAQKQYVSSVRIAGIEAALGDRDQAFAWLDRAYAGRDSRLALLEVLPEFTSLRSDARYAALIERLHLPAPQARH